MHTRELIINYISALFEEVIDSPPDILLITGYRRRRYDNRVSRTNTDPLVGGQDVYKRQLL